jgi:uncharacterized HAD superfamily protein
MIKLNIAFDLDGTCVDLKSQFTEFIRQNTGIELGDYTKFDCHEEAGLSKEEFWKGVHQAYDAWQLTPIYPGVFRIMKELNRISNDSIYFVTARPKAFASQTFQLINRFCPYPFKVSMCDNSDDKGLYLRGYSMFVEDRRRTALQLMSQGKIVYVPERSYNIHPHLNRLPGGIENLVNYAKFFVSDSLYRRFKYGNS